MILNISVTVNHGIVSFVATTFRSFPQSWYISRFVTRVRYYDGCHCQSSYCLLYRSTCVHPRLLAWFFLLFSFLNSVFSIIVCLFFSWPLHFMCPTSVSSYPLISSNFTLPNVWSASELLLASLALYVCFIFIAPS